MKRMLVALLVAAAPATVALGGDLIFFDDEDDFVAFNSSEGKVLKGLETFEENNLGPNNVAAFPSPLEGGVPNGPFPPTGSISLICS